MEDGKGLFISNKKETIIDAKPVEVEENDESILFITIP